MGQAQTALHSLAPVETLLHPSQETDAEGTTGKGGLDIGHKRTRPLVELRRLAHEQCLPEIVLRQSGVGVVK